MEESNLGREATSTCAAQHGGNVQQPFVGVFGKNAPDIRVRFDFSPSDIAHKTDEIIAISEKTHDAVAAVPLSQVSYERVIAPLAMLEAEQFALAQSCEFPSMVSTSKAIRDASTEAEKKLDAHNVKCSMRVDVYRAVKAYAQTKPKLEAEAQRYLDRLIRDFERLGLSLSPETRAEVERLKTRMGELSIQYQRNLNEENTILHFTEEELAGMPEDFIKGLNKRQDDGKFEVTLKYPHYFPIMEQCKVGQTRQIMEKAFNSRCMAENTPILEELIYLRHQMSQLLGYKTHAHYILDIRMAKTPEKVMEFLNGVSVKIGPLAQRELERLKELKKEEEGSATFTMADFRYYMRRSEKLEFNIDHEALKEYFPIDVVTEGLFKIYQQLLGLKFTEVSDPHAWHADVQLFAVKDLETEEPLGYFYLDLYPRDGKYGHACVCPLQPGCYLLDGSRMRPVAAMLANFSKPMNNKPSLLKHSEVETYFHEFGHVMHHICSHVTFARFSGTRVERDFVEAPSQMLENWCWEKPSLKLMSGYYKEKSTPIPDTLCDTLVSTKKAHAGLLTKRQLLFGLFDQAIHTTQRADTALVLKALHPQVMMGIPATEGTNFAASFGHLAGGYDASYYGYMWSEVFSADMFATKFKDNVLSRAGGREYREKVLRPGGSLDAAVILRNFLGRDPTDEAFLESKGVTKARLALAASKAKGPASGSGVSSKGV